MNSERLQYFKRKLLKERNNAVKLLHKMEDNETTNMNLEMSAELSFYDNHSGDLASEMNDMARGRAFKEHEISIVKKIDDALMSIEKGEYGNCHRCNSEIPEERLDFLPYAQYCVSCQTELNSLAEKDKSNRGPEEEVLGRPFGYGYNDYEDDPAYDAEDSYQDVQRYDWLENRDYEYDLDDEEGVEPIERISNAQYKNQLPD
jgi:YteA family regulatory protein